MAARKKDAELHRRLTHGELLQLKRWNTPTVCNGWEKITRHDAAREGFNLEETHDFMPHLGSMAGYAVTAVIEPGNPRHPADNPQGWCEYWHYIGSLPGPKIVVMQDLDKPKTFGAAWGEVNASIHRALGCVGVIVDGAIRDLDEMNHAGFKALARRLCVSHAHAHPVRWNCPVTVFGRRVEPGQLIHADKHGFLVIPPEDEARLLEAVCFMDNNECNTLISAGRSSSGLTTAQALARLDQAAADFVRAADEKFTPAPRTRRPAGARPQCR
ncbi:MAG: RraA family protein [Planctomycetota bacterium]